MRPAPPRELWRHAIAATVRLILAAASLACKENEVEIPATDPLGLEGAIWIDVTLTPESGAPGAEVRVDARVFGPNDLTLDLDVPGLVSIPMTRVGAEGGQQVYTATAVARSTLGLQTFGVRGFTSGVNVLGYASYDATKQGPCAAGELREAGRCVPRSNGHALEATGYALISLGHPAGVDPEDKDIRSMLHPRQLVRIGNATVGCHSDHIGMVWLGDYLQAGTLQAAIDGTLADLDQFSKDDGVTPRTETVFTDIDPDLGFCENFAYAPQDDAGLTGLGAGFVGVGVTSHGGSGSKKGGLAVWAIPNADAPKCSACDARFDAPKLLHLYADDIGYAGVVFDGDILYAAREPSSLAVFRVEPDGALSPLAEIVVPELRSVWKVALSKREDGQKVLFISDPSPPRDDVVVTVTEGPEGLDHLGVEHHERAGRLFSVDVTEPAAPVTLGWGPTQGATKGIAVLPNDVVAVANGSAGIELMDVSDPVEPTSVWIEDTPGTASNVSYANGYLTVADWDNVRLYDVGERGVLRLIDSTDMGLFAELFATLQSMPGPEGSNAPSSDSGGETGDPGPAFLPTLAIGFVHLDADGTFYASDLDRIFFGKIAPGARAPRLLLQDGRKQVRTEIGAATDTIPINVVNGSTSPTWVRMDVISGAKAASSLILPPGGSGVFEVKVDTPPGGAPISQLSFSTAGPYPSSRTVRLEVIQGQFNVGDVAPHMALPAINWCEAGEDCDLEARCVDLYEAPWRDRPFLMAVFTSW
ncbi:MAG: hypothetical protein IV100_27010 [Myxococcales bacterium]|nr:hypothetical protein [Myxococcales bacterium]